MNSIDPDLVGFQETLSMASNDLNAMRRALFPRKSYSVLADAVIWSDEIPFPLASSLDDALRLLLRYRTSVILGEPEERLAPLWRWARATFPQWPAFAPSRSRPSRSVVRFVLRSQAKAMAAAEDLIDQE